MLNRLKGKTVLISGASAGIGEACAKKFAEAGANLILTARRLERLQKLAALLKEDYGVNVFFYAFDVREKKAVAALGEDLEKSNQIPDIFINNAGLSQGKDPFFTANINDWETMIDTNIKGLLYMARTIIPLMLKKEEGHMINIGSIAGEEVYPGGNVYNATKFAVKGLSRAMNLDLINTKLKVSNVAPGAVDTEFSLVRFKGDKEQADAVYGGFTPLSADDIADTILYVANAPHHVNVQYTLVTPTAQRTVNFINKNDLI